MGAPRDKDKHLPPGFRKWDISRRRESVVDLLTTGSMTREMVRKALGVDTDLIDLSDIMVESAIGYAGIPLGVCRGLIVDGRTVDVALATEEPSVIAAVSYASGIIARSGGFETHADDPIVTGQIFVEGAKDDATTGVMAAEERIRAAVAPVLRNMENRGGGYRGLDAIVLPSTGLLRVQIHLDVRDAMGANLVNSAAEAARPVIETVTGGKSLMAILTNSAEQRLAGARISIPVTALARSGCAGVEVARRIALASDLAEEDDTRAVTHNKGIMNGVSALMLATGNDTRAVEAAAHRYASREGHYSALATYRIAGDTLEGRIELPLPVGTVGGAAGTHPTSRLAFALMGNPGATELARIAAAIGLAQNLAAVMALVTEGIQTGHMALHSRRLAWLAGARGDERTAVSELLAGGGNFNVEAAAAALARVREAKAAQPDTSTADQSGQEMEYGE